MNLPNRLTLLRIVLIPVIILLWIFPYSSFGFEPIVFQIGAVSLSAVRLAVTAVFGIAVLTDVLDGWLARSRNMMTTFGKFADPIADRLLYTVMFLLFVNDGLISLVPVFIMIARDAVEDGCRIVASANEKEVHAGTMGKLKNILQRITIVLILLNNLPFELWGLPVSGVLLWFTAFVSFVSGVQYFNQMKEDILESR